MYKFTKFKTNNPAKANQIWLDGSTPKKSFFVSIYTTESDCSQKTRFYFFFFRKAKLLILNILIQITTLKSMKIM